VARRQKARLHDDFSAAPTMMMMTTTMAQIFSESHQVQCLLDFEAALARALVAARIAPVKVSAVIKSKCEARLYEIEPIVSAASGAGNLAIPLVKELTGKVAHKNAMAADFVH